MSIKNITFVLALGCSLLFACTNPAKKQTATSQTPKPSSTRDKSPAGPQSEFTYKKTPQADLKVYLDYPQDWKSSDRRAAIVFFGGGG